MIGTKLAHYVVTSHLGSGGMGEVYQATDTKLGRSVAIKVLPAAFASDTDHLSRFRREAHLLASLNHSNIAAIYGLEEDGGFRFLILELVEGETLAERLKRGPIPLDDALKIATQIAEGLGAAHDRGILHRDLKPANIKLTPDGKVKVLDFGLAKAFVAGGGSNSNLPTEATVTMPGMIMGTASYMSPEQASGKDTERTSDVWAFGCVLYEMFTGHRVFEGETVTEILSNVMKAEPDWTRLPDDTPDGIRRLLRRCLQKERRSRLHDIADARIEIEETQSGPRVKEHAAVISKWSFARGAGITALVVGLAGAFVAAGLYFRSTIDNTAELRLEISLPRTAGAFAVSPDGSKLVFVNTTEGQSRLWLRPLASTEATPMAGTEGAIGSPFWSPDSQSIGFFPNNALKRIDVIGGSVRNPESESSPDLKGSRGVLIFSAPTGAWGQNDALVFAPNVDTPLYRVPEKGGWGVPITRLDRPRQLVHLSPQFLPDGHHFLFYADGPAEGRGVYIGSLESPDPRRLFDADGPAVFMPPEYLLFIRGGALYAQRFDLRKFVPAGEDILVAQQAASFSAAAGVIAYRPPATGEPKFTWFDRTTGKSLEAVGESLQPLGSDGGASLSPDDRWLAMHRGVHANIDVWLLDLSRGLTEPLTDDPLVDGYPIWSPDSKFIAFLRSISGTQWDLYVKPADGVSAETVLLSEPSAKRALDWSPDGRSILFVRDNHLYALPVTPDGKPDGKSIPLTDTNKNSVEGQGKFSPDGRWIAYQSNQSGKNQIYLQPFPGPGRRQPVSTEGGTHARWNRNGKELFYVAPGNKLMAVPVALSADGQRADVGTPTPIAPNLRMQPYYSVRADGQRILMNAPIGEPNNPPVTVILNWKPPPK